jgi:hypothetical protein
LTGLLFTTSPFTIPARNIELTALISEEKSDSPDFTFSEMPSVSVTAGISSNMELALKGSYVHETGADGIKKRGAGNTELSYKWNFLPQDESSARPALALIITGITATLSEEVAAIEATVEKISHWGARAGLSAGSEFEWGDHVIGIFADGSITVHDLNNQERRDRYGIFNVGAIIPISKYRNLQMMLEYRLVNGINNLKSNGDDFSAVTTSLRLVTEHVNLSIGTQFIDKRSAGLENSNRILGMTGVKF